MAARYRLAAARTAYKMALTREPDCNARQMNVTGPNKTDTPLRYRVDDLVVDVGRYCVSRNGVELEVTGRSFELLLALIRAAPNAVSLDQLMTEVWRGMVVNSETVTQRVKVLRQALGDSPEQPRYIASVRGHGYRLLSEVALLTEPVVFDRKAAAETAGEGTQAPQAQPSPGLPRYVRFGIPAVGLLTLLAVGAWWFIRTNTQAPTIARDSVAVLPFANMTGDASKEYLADGMAEELINTLSKVPGLKVPARTSSFVYKGRNVSIRDIAKDLQVGTILEGSVRTAGTRIRITAQLINARDGLHLWSQTYDEEFGDLFKLQDKLATAIATALQPQLVAAGLNVAQAPPTPDIEAYNLYLQGVSLVYRTSAENAARATQYFQQSLARDPKFARAWAMMAQAQIGWSQVDSSRINELLGSAALAAQQALALDPDIADAHAVLAGVDANRFRMFDAMIHNRTALKLAPNDGYIQAITANGLYMLGHRREAREVFNTAYQLAPANPFVIAFLANFHSLEGDDSEALKLANIARDLGFPEKSFTLSSAYVLSALRSQDYLKAAGVISSSVDTADAEQAQAAEMFQSVLSALAGKRQRSSVIATAKEVKDHGRSLKTWGPCLSSAMSYTLLGAVDKAYELANSCLDRAVADSSWSSSPIPFFLWTPELRPFRRDARLQALLARIGAMDYYQQYGPPDDCDLKDGKLTCH